MTRNEAITFLKSLSTLTKSGKTDTFHSKLGDYRFVAKPRVLRLEVPTELGAWVMVKHAPYGQLKIVDGKLSGMKSWHL